MSVGQSQTLDGIIENLASSISGAPRSPAEEVDLPDADEDVDTLEDDESEDEPDATEPDEEGDEPDAEGEEEPAKGALDAFKDEILGILRPLTQTVEQLQQERQTQAQISEQEATQKAVEEFQQRWETMPENEADKEKMQVIAVLLQREREEKQKLQSQIDMQQQIRNAQAEHEQIVMFIAGGGRRVGEKYIHDHADPLSAEDMAELRDYVMPDGPTMERWADARINRRQSNKRKARDGLKQITSREVGTARVPGQTSSSRKKEPAAPETLDDVLTNLSDRVARSTR